MGCCEGKYIIEGTENEIENQIRDAMVNLEINTISISEFEEKFRQIMKVQIHEVIESKWYTQDAFHTLVNSTLINQKLDSAQTKSQFNLILKADSDTKKFPFYFFLQISSLLRGSFEEKVIFLEKGAKTHMNPFTVKQMKVLIFQYLDLNLLKVTNNYIENSKLSMKPDAQNLISRVYTDSNVKAYSTSFIKGIQRMVLKSRPFLKDNPEAMDNESIKSGEFREFFLENRILLDGLELRKSFYTRFTNPSSSNPNDTTADVTVNNYS